MGTKIQISIAGNLVADPELSVGESGVAHAKLRVAVNRDLVELEAELVTELDKFSLRTFTQVTTCRRVEDNLQTCRGQPAGYG